MPNFEIIITKYTMIGYQKMKYIVPALSVFFYFLRINLFRQILLGIYLLEDFPLITTVKADLNDHLVV